MEHPLKGFFYPVWGSNPPDPIVAYRDSMPQSNGEKIFLFGNCCALNGDTGHHFRKILETKGYTVFYNDHCIMPTNFNLPYEPENYWKRVPPPEEKERICAAAEKKLYTACDAILCGEQYDDGNDTLDKIAGMLQRKTYWIGNGYKSHFSIAKDKCIECGLCIRMCPTHNITENEEGQKVFGDNCILCVKCYNLCPKNAVLICQKSIDDDKYPRYKGPDTTIKPVEYRSS